MDARIGPLDEIAVVIMVPMHRSGIGHEREWRRALNRCVRIHCLRQRRGRMRRPPKVVYKHFWVSSASTPFTRCLFARTSIMRKLMFTGAIIDRVLRYLWYIFTFYIMS